jgi:glutamyl-tRNA synthetase
MTQKILVRFAPSPTGWLHVGNARTALANYLFAKSQGGQFMLRIDDTDLARSSAEYEEGIRGDLQWLGLPWDITDKQSARFARYDLAKEKLVADGRLYPCYETPEELDVKRKMLISRGLPPIYDRAGLDESAAKRAEYESMGRRPHWRFKLNHAPIVWDDMIRGRTEFDGAKLSDPVLIREDGVALFTLSTSVDDGEHGITHIIRGEDHVSNTATQVQIMEALGHTPPRFGHMALLKMKEGKISKRTGGGDVKSLREAGVFPLVLVSYLAKIGTSDAIDLAESMDALVANFRIDKLGRSMANYDPSELERLNQKLLHHLSFDEVKPQLEARGMGSIDANFWNNIKANLHTVDDARDWWAVLQQPITPKIDDAEFIAQAASLLPSGEWGEGSWDQLVEAVKAATGRKGKELFMPLRLALTGMEHGPEMKVVLALLGRDRAERRLRGEVS